LAIPSSFVAEKGTGPGARWSRADLAQWWRAFHDPELNALVEQAVAANPDVEIALDRLQEARSIVMATIGAALPSGEASAAVATGTGSDNTRSRVSPDLTSAVNTGGYDKINEAGGFAAGWDLDIFGKQRREIEAAKDDADAAADDREGVLVAVAAGVARAYLDMRALQARLAVAHRSIDAARRNLDLVQNRAKQGITNDLDVTLAQRELATFEATVPPIEAEIATARYVIAVLLGRYPKDVAGQLAGVKPLPPFPQRIAIGTPSDLVRRRPDIQEAERQLAAATARIGVATADLYPDITLSGAVGGQGGSLAKTGAPLTFIGAVGPSLYWPVLDFGTLDARVDYADFRAKEFLAKYKGTVLNAVEQVDEAIVSYRGQEARLRDLARAITAAKQAETLASERYDRGLTDFLNVLDAERQEYELQAEYVLTQEAAADQLVALYKALGGGWEAYQAVPPIPPPQPAIVAAITRASAKTAPTDPPIQK
jgi:NodT family efflux transporter outer membrane factor (OMF) lipoprotein